MTISFHIFETAIGGCALAWSDQGICGVWLPERNIEALRGRVLRRFAHALECDPPSTVASIVERIVSMMTGKAVAFGDVTLDLQAASDFDRQVYQIARAIPYGETLTYGDIATKLGDVQLSRDVGQAMGSNRFPIIVPCHRVIAAHGKLGGFSAPGGTDTKRRLLEIENARTSKEPGLFDRRD